jgi:parallel beta-helix repeat protein
MDMKKGLSFAVITLFIGIALAPCITASEPTSNQAIYSDDNGTLSGYVNDTSMNPIEGARVRVHFHETYKENYTDSSGYYHVTNIPICRCSKNATASKDGYTTEWVLLTIWENTTLDFVLTPLGKTLYVGGTGAGNYTTIQSAIDDANSGDTVFVYSGTYYENVVIDETLILIGEDKQSTIIDGGGSGDVVYVSADEVRINGFMMRNSGKGSNECGIYIFGSTMNTISKNILENNECGISVFDCRGIIVSENTVSSCYGHPGIIVKYTDNSSFQNNIVADSGVGLTISHAQSNLVFNNTFKRNHYGVYVSYSNHNQLYNNSIGHNLGDGTYLYSSEHNTLSHNFISSNQYNGIYLDSSWNNSVVMNGIFNNTICGINIGGGSCNNIIHGNDICFYQNRGVRIHSSDKNNHVYHNNFKDNIQNAEDSGDNIWDNEYTFGGNYWDDYAGEDWYHGPNQDIPGSDGIGDTPHEILCEHGKDRYPLMEPYPTPRMDVNITGGLGLSITVMNSGNVVFENQTIHVIIDGPMILFGEQSLHTTIILNLGEETTFGLFLFGFGKVTVTVTIDSWEWTFKVFLLGPFILVLDNDGCVLI